MLRSRLRQPVPSGRRRPAGWRAGLVMALLSFLSAAYTAAATVTPELKRAARQMNVTPEALQQARQTLREVTDLASRQPPFPADLASPLATAWSRLHPREAPAQLERIFRTLNMQLQNAEPAESVPTQLAMAGVLRSLANVDPDRAWTLMQQWPAVEGPPEEPPIDGPAARHPPTERIRQQARESVLAELVRCDPDRATPLLEAMARENPAGLMQGGSWMYMLQQTRPELWTKLADEALKAYKDQPLTRQTMGNYMQLLRGLNWTDPDLIAPTARQAIQQLKSMGPENIPDRAVVLRVQDESVRLEGAEAMALEVVRSLRSSPGLAMEVMAEFPGLAEKLNKIGGSDVVFRPSSGTTSRNNVMEEDLTPMSRRRSSDGSGGGFGSRMVGRQCPNDSKPSQALRARLRELASQESGFDQLVREATNLSYSQPEMGEEALRLAEGLVDENAEPAVKAERWIRLVNGYAMMDSEISSNLLEKAFTAVQELQDTPPDEAEARPPPQPGMDPVARMQTELFKALARSDGTRALERARRLTDERARMIALLGVMQGLLGHAGDFIGYGGYFR